LAHAIVGNLSFEIWHMPLLETFPLTKQRPGDLVLGSCSHQV